MTKRPIKQNKIKVNKHSDEKASAKKLGKIRKEKKDRKKSGRKITRKKNLLIKREEFCKIEEQNTEINEVINDSNEINHGIEQVNEEIISSPPEKVERIRSSPIHGSQYITTKEGLKIYKYPIYKFTDHDEAKCKTIIVVGQTGSGKTTLLNALINFVHGVKYDDDFRYNIIVEKPKESEAHSQTKGVNIYYIPPKNGHPPIKIIDTQGFEDTRGLPEDKKIKEKIEEIFKTEIKYITAICFVAQASNVTLTATQKYIFRSILGMFGNDVGENFIPLLTFCDGTTPKVINAMKEKGSGFDIIIPKIKETPWYLTFNNSGVFNKTSLVSKIYWDIGFESFKIFLKRLERLPDKSLQLSEEVLRERRSIELKLNDLQPKLDEGLSMMEVIRDQLDFIKQNIDKINTSKDFVIKSKQRKYRKEPISGACTTFCNNCFYTCHDPCYLPPSSNKMECISMDNKGKCQVCPGECPYYFHSNNEFKITYYWEHVEEHIKEKEKAFYDAKNNKSKAEQLLKYKEKKFEAFLIECLEIQEEIKQSIDRLKQISLLKTFYESSEDYINILISSEFQEKRPGFNKRIKALKELKKQHQELRNLYDGKNITMMKLQDFVKNYIVKKKAELKNYAEEL